MEKYLYLYFCALIASFGGFLNGYDTGVISGALLYIEKSFNLSPSGLGFLVSSVSIGAILGAFINGFLIDKIGRKKVLLLTAFIFFMASICCFCSKNAQQLILSRLLIGCAVGVVSFAGPLYLSEISTKEKRGQIVSLYQLAITFGILFSYISNYLCANLEHNWRIMLLIGVFPALFLFIGFLFLPDTPRFLILKNNIDEAKRVLSKISDTNTDIEVKNISSTIVSKGLKFEKWLIYPFIVGIGIMFAQIATGINAIIYYAPSIFKLAGFSSNQDALFITIFIGLINFLVTFVAIAYSDKIGRKPLLYIGLSGMLISLLVLSFVFLFDYSFLKYFSVIFCALYIVSFSMSLGPIGLLLISEVFPLRFRGSAMSFAIVSNFIFNFIVTWMFPIALDKIGGFLTFLIFALTCIVSILFVRFFVPETKGISLEEIENNWKKRFN